ncbi:MAG: ABC transporter permease subunit [Bacilli bacterium]
MFSKSLFKQSCKANGLMWGIVTLMVCFMLSCVMVISGGGSTESVATGVTDTIVDNEIKCSLKERAITYYNYSNDGEAQFDNYYVNDFSSDVSEGTVYYQAVGAWVVSLKEESLTGIPDCYNNVSSIPTPVDNTSTVTTSLYSDFVKWCKSEPQASSYDLTTLEGQKSYSSDLSTWQNTMPSTTLIGTYSATSAYISATTKLSEYCLTLAQKEDSTATSESTITKEISGTIFVSINPGNSFDNYYTEHNLDVPSDYDVTSLVTHTLSGDITTYLGSEERISYYQDRATNGSAVFLAYLFSNKEAKQTMIDALSNYGITEERYESYGYDFDTINHLAQSTNVGYQSQIDYELSLIYKDYVDGKYASIDEYNKAVEAKKIEVKKDSSSSFLSNLPTEVSEALEEVGQMDVYSLIVGSVYFKMAGLLLPIIYIIMAANNLISTQVDSGSMAYVLSTSVKRSTVTFTQASYLVISLLAMSLCTMITSFICFANVKITNTDMSYATLALMSLGQFAVLFAIAGFNFMTSCIFDRQKNSMSIGGGLSIFFLVATMLGLFGSEQIPSVVRFDSLNYFNYVTIISLFDITSIVNGTTDFIYKMVILFAVGIICFVSGSLVFKNKDLPL